MNFNVEGGTKKSTVDKNLPTKDVPKYKKKEKSKSIEGKGTINLGNINITLGGVYDSGQAKESYPSNIYNIPDRKSKQIYRKLEAQLGYNINKDTTLNLKLDRDKLNNLPSKQKNISLGLTGKLGKGAFNIEAGKGKTKYGKLRFKIPFSTGGKVHRGRKAMFK